MYMYAHALDQPRRMNLIVARTTILLLFHGVHLCPSSISTRDTDGFTKGTDMLPDSTLPTICSLAGELPLTTQGMRNPVLVVGFTWQFHDAVS